MTIAEMKAELVRLSNEATGLQQTADTQGRALTAEEQAAIDHNLSRFEGLTAEVERRERIRNAATMLNAPAPRRTGPGSNQDHAARGVPELGRVLPRRRRSRAGPGRSPAHHQRRGRLRPGGHLRRRRVRAPHRRPERDPVGDHVAAVDLRPARHAVHLGQLDHPAVRREPGLGREPGFTRTPSPRPRRSPPAPRSSGRHAITLAKNGTLVYVTEEMLSDVQNIGGFVTRRPRSLAWTMNVQAYTANGAASVKPVAKTSVPPPRPPRTWTTWSRCGSASTPASARTRSGSRTRTSSRPSALSCSGRTTRSTCRPAGCPRPLYNTLFGKPVIFSELAAAEGTVGRHRSSDPTSFWGVVKNGGASSAISAHFKFDQELVAYRATTRSAVLSKLAGVITRPDSTTCSNVVVLATRA